MPLAAIPLSQAQQQIFSTIQAIDWSRPSWDVIIFLFFIISAFLYGFSLGRDRIIVILVAIYMGLAIANTAPFLPQLTEKLPFGQLFALKLTTFLGIFLILFFLLSRSALHGAIGGRRESFGRWWEVLIYSVLHIGLIISILLSYLPPKSLQSLAPLTQTIFASDIGRFVWILAPIVAMFAIRPHHHHARDLT